jgi:cytochrome c553
MKLALLCLSLGLIVGGVDSAFADDADLVKKGRILAYTCHGCHGSENYKNTYPTYSVPVIGGQSAEYVIDALKQYASGDRAHNTMHAHAASMSDQDRIAIAAFIEGPKRSAAGAQSGTPPASTAVCVTCHGSDGTGIAPNYPVLAGQHRDYLEQALRDYKSGKRKNVIMAGIVGQIDDNDIPAIAAYFAKQKSPLCTTDKLRDKGKCE